MLGQYWTSHHQRHEALWDRASMGSDWAIQVYLTRKETKRACDMRMVSTKAKESICKRQSYLTKSARIRREKIDKILP